MIRVWEIFFSEVVEVLLDAGDAGLFFHWYSESATGPEKECCTNAYADLDTSRVDKPVQEFGALCILF